MCVSFHCYLTATFAAIHTMIKDRQNVLELMNPKSAKLVEFKVPRRSENRFCESQLSLMM
jgi:hypothetical protein